MKKLFCVVALLALCVSDADAARGRAVVRGGGRARGLGRNRGVFIRGGFINPGFGIGFNPFFRSRFVGVPVVGAAVYGQAVVQQAVYQQQVVQQVPIVQRQIIQQQVPCVQQVYQQPLMDVAQPACGVCGQQGIVRQRAFGY